MKQVRDQIAAMKQAAQPGIDPWVTQKQKLVVQAQQQLNERLGLKPAQPVSRDSR